MKMGAGKKLLGPEDRTYRRKLKELRAAVREGMQSPIVEDFSIEKFKAELDLEAKRRRLSG
jgi:hypothetical protein